MKELNANDIKAEYSIPIWINTRIGFIVFKDDRVWFGIYFTP